MGAAVCHGSTTVDPGFTSVPGVSLVFAPEPPPDVPHLYLIRVQATSEVVGAELTRARAIDLAQGRYYPCYVEPVLLGAAQDPRSYGDF